MDPLTLLDRTTGSTAHIAAHRGFNCYALAAVVDGRAIDVIDAVPDFAAGNGRESGEGIPILFPFPNRIRNGEYTWRGERFRIPPEHASFDPLGNAIHGFCLDRPWRVVSRADHFAVGRFQLSVDAPDRSRYWAADFVIEVRYELRNTTLRCDVEISNPDDRPLPWGFGTHPYFRLPLDPSSDPAGCVVEAPAGEQWELADYLPTGERRPVSGRTDLRPGVRFKGLKLDDVLTGLTVENQAVTCAIVDEAAGLEVTQRCDPAFRELVVYTPAGRNAVCLEPYTCVTDAINLQERGIDAGWQSLEPGESFQTWIEICAGPVLA